MTEENTIFRWTRDKPRWTDLVSVESLGSPRPLDLGGLAVRFTRSRWSLAAVLASAAVAEWAAPSIPPRLATFLPIRFARSLLTGRSAPRSLRGRRFAPPSHRSLAHPSHGINSRPSLPLRHVRQRAPRGLSPERVRWSVARPRLPLLSQSRPHLHDGPLDTVVELDGVFGHAPVALRRVERDGVARGPESE